MLFFTKGEVVGCVRKEILNYRKNYTLLTHQNHD